VRGADGMTNVRRQAVILAGGQGTRLRPYTTVLPKALIPMGDRPILELLLLQLKHAGFTRVTLAVGHMASVIQSFVGDGRRWGMTIDYVMEHQPLGTAGPLLLLQQQLPEHFLVMNADVLSNIDFNALFTHHCASNAAATIATYNRQTVVPFGVMNVQGPNHTISNFVEKPRLEHWVSMGVYAFNRRILKLIEADRLFGFDHLMHAMLSARETVQAYPFEGYWRDIGCIEDYEQAVNDLKTYPSLMGPVNDADYRHAQFQMVNGL
jgi:NDP-mannose synthase